MKNAVKTVYYLILAFSFTLILADYGLIDRTVSHFHSASPVECSDVASDAEHFSADCFGDDVILSEWKVKTSNLASLLSVVPVFSDPDISQYLSCIWQPPKVS